MSGEVLRVTGLGKSFRPRRGAALEALRDISLSAAANDFLCLVGPSGCGKSTLLRILAGLDQASAGQVLYHGRPLTSPLPQVGLVFQEYSLLPWRNVLDNVTLGPDRRGDNKAPALAVTGRAGALVILDGRRGCGPLLRPRRRA